MPVSITLFYILSWTVRLPGLSDRFGSQKRTYPKQAIEWKKCIKSSIQNIIRRKKYFYSVKLPFEQVYNPPKNALGHISTLDSTHLFVVRLFFQKCAKICNFWKVALRSCEPSFTVNERYENGGWLFSGVRVSNGLFEVHRGDMLSTRMMCVTAAPTVPAVPTKETALSWWLWQCRWWWWWE